MSKHTPGPWSLNKYHEPVGPDGENIRAKGLALTNTPEAMANSRLIAAAPELLASAKTVLDGLNARIDAADPAAVPVFAGIAELHDAIAKAEGRS